MTLGMGSESDGSTPDMRRAIQRNRWRLIVAQSSPTVLIAISSALSIRVA
jgi:hypothetical protein